MPALLQLDKVTIRFGGLTAVNSVDFTVNENELCGLIGPNGAGKTTVFNLITGVYQPTDGKILLCGRDLARLRVNEIVTRGIARTFQNIRLFGSLSVFDNVRVACNQHRATSPIHSLVRLGAFHDTFGNEINPRCVIRIDRAQIIGCIIRILVLPLCP